MSKEKYRERSFRCRKLPLVLYSFSVSTPFALIGQSWKFYLKQPVLLPVAVWLLFLPMLGYKLLMMWLLRDGMDIDWTNSQTILAILGVLCVSLLMLWGTCCTLAVGKRMLQSSAGRKRTSFRTVASQGRRLIIPLLLTGILRDCYSILWALLLIIPGIIYSLRTSFYAVIVAGEGVAYQEALTRSKEAMKGREVSVILTILAVAILLFIPIMMLEQAAAELIPEDDMLGTGLFAVFSSGLRAIATVLSLLSLTHLYAEVRHDGPVTGTYEAE